MKINKLTKELMLTHSKLEKLYDFHKYKPNCVEANGWSGHTLYIVRLWENEDGYILEMFPLLHTIKNIRP